MKYTLIRLTPQGFIEHKNVTSTFASEGKIHTTVDGELYTYVSPSTDLAKIKAIMLNEAVGAAKDRIKKIDVEMTRLLLIYRDITPEQAAMKTAKVEIERLRSLKGWSHA